MLEQGANDFVSSFTSTLDMLAGDFAQEMWILGGLMFGISDAGTNRPERKRNITRKMPLAAKQRKI